jgi:hypothetical protein
MYFEHLFHRRKLWEGGSVHESQKIKKSKSRFTEILKFVIFENFTNKGDSIRDINEGSRK